jgi:hypothetical protein
MLQFFFILFFFVTEKISIKESYNSAHTKYIFIYLRIYIKANKVKSDEQQFETNEKALFCSFFFSGHNYYRISLK